MGGGKHFQIRKRYLGSHFQLITVHSSNKHELKILYIQFQSVYGLVDLNHVPTLGIFKLYTSLLLRDPMDTSLVAEGATLAR